MMKMTHVLFIHSERIGEFLLSLPAIKIFRANHPETKIYLMANKENIELIRQVDFIDYFVDCAEYYQSKRGTWKLAKFFKAEKIDAVFAFSAKKYFNCAAWLARLPLRVGYNKAMGFFLNKKLEDTRHLELKHESQYVIDLVRPFCPDLELRPIDIPVMAKTNLEFLKVDLDKKYIFIHPFSDDQNKQVDVIFWLELIRMIKANLNQEIVLIGSASDKSEAKYYQEKGGMHNVAGKLRLSELAAFIKHNSSLFIGLDSGPMHLAAMLSCPVVALFRGSNPLRWSPLSEKALLVNGKDAESFRMKISSIINFAQMYKPHG
jgi:ADP-heptose:LPS heptosyltransferase